MLEDWNGTVQEQFLEVIHIALGKEASELKAVLVLQLQSREAAFKAYPATAEAVDQSISVSKGLHADDIYAQVRSSSIVKARSSEYL
jgi:hypothetical protein